MVRLKRLYGFWAQVIEEWSEDNCFRLAAALSYYTIFSLAPIILIVITTAGSLLGRDAVSGEVYRQIRGLIGVDGALAVQSLVQNAYLERHGFIATVVSVGTLVFSSTVLFTVLQDSLNTIWKVRVRGDKSIIKFLITRGLSFALVLVIGFLLIVSLAINAILVALQGYMIRLIGPASAVALQLAEQATSLGVITLLFALMFKYLPDVRVRWRNVWQASLLTAVLFTIGKSLIGLYLGQSNLATTYGAAASVIIIMLWVNYSSWIFFLGAEYIYVLHRVRGETIVPNRYAARYELKIEG